MIKLPSAIGLVILLILSELQWTLLIHASDDSLIAGNSLLDGDPISSNGTSTSTFSPSDFYIVDFNETDSPHELPILSLSSLPSSSASSSSSSSSSTSPPSLTDSLLPSSSLTSAESASSASFSLPTDFINNSSSSANFSITYQLDDLHSESSFQHNRQDIGPWVKHDSNPGYGNRPSSSSSFNSESNDDYDEDGKSGPVHRPSSSIYNRPSYQHGGPSSHSYPTSSPSPSSSSSSSSSSKSQILRHEYSYQPASGRSTGFKYNGPQVRQSHEDSSSSNKEDYRRVARKDMRRDHHENGNSGNPVGGPVVRHEWMNIDHGNSGSSEGNEGPIPPPNSQSHGPHHSYSNGNNNSPNNHNNNNQHPSKYQSSGYQAQPGPQHQPIQPPYAPQAQSTSDSDDTSWGNSQSSGDGSNEGSPSIQYDEPSMRQSYDEEASESEESEEDDEITSSGPEVIVKHQIHHSQHQDQQHQTGPHIQQHHVTTINHPSPSGPTYPVPQAHGNNNNNNHESATGLTKHDENYWNGPSSSMDGFSKFRKMKEAEKEGLMVLPMSRVQINSRADKPQKREYSVSTKYKKGKKYEKKYKKVKSKKKKKKKCCKKKKCKKAKKCKPKKKKCKKPKKKCCEKEEKEWGEWPEMEVVFKKPKKKKKSKGWDSWGGYGDSYGSYEGKETEYLNAKDILGAEYLVEPPIGNADIYIEKKEPHSEEEEEEHEDEEEEDQKEDREDKEPAKIEPMSAIKQRETATGISEGGDNSGGANVQKNQQQSKQLKPVTKYEVDRPYEVHEVDMFPPKFESDPLNFGVSALGGGFDPMLNNARLDARFPGLTGPFSGQESNTENKGDIGRIKSKGSTIGNTRDSTRIGASVSLNNDGERSSVTNENKYKKRPPQHPEIIDVDDVSASSKVETQSQQEQHPNHQPTDQQQTRVDLRDRSSVNNESGRGQVEGSSDWKKMNEPDEPWKANQAQIEGDRWSTDIIHRNDWRVGAKQPPPKSDDVVDP
ncbi:LOW QUALITY PROTEIN: uncharacterized protein DDB_G0283697-like [Panonychus citri]|uniref:LOW QUALITY PROTEIN: uncharacterized protein DDB_G0283697-like n=1 Tax=Panonychus citri TaxID=50023 RepID=UPI002307204D|nr:LOW QUALITY PROTEIN: uncharacterized protein DDB_G0283697-like [Panonychus citri]